MGNKEGSGASTQLDAVIVGAGFAGLYMLHRLRGLGLKARVYEAGGGVGGTWYWNRYPGARCDVESFQYAYQFDEQLQQDWDWTERYATQGEILAYLEHVAERYDLKKDIAFNTRVEALAFDEAANLWHVKTDQGEASARFVILATGCLSCPNLPKIEGIDSFAGETYHTGQWPQEPVSFAGKRVGVIGTGSSGVQVIPLIAQEAGHLYIFQRTPSYSIPAQNRVLSQAERREVKAHYAEMRQRAAQNPFTMDFKIRDEAALEADEARRQECFEEGWAKGGVNFVGSFSDLLISKEANALAADFVRDKIRQTVTDSAVAEKLMPPHMLGCKRVINDIGYYETFNRPNVTLVDASDEPIAEITPQGVRTGKATYSLDAIVYATGYDALTGAILKINIKGRDGLTMHEAWAEGPKTYLGLMVAGFPNLFTITGPGSPSVLTNMVPSIEQHVDWIADCISTMQAQGQTVIDATPEAQDAWVTHVAEVGAQTLFTTCNNWYLGANIEGKPRVFLPYFGFQAYVAKCDGVVAGGYEGFRLEA